MLRSIHRALVVRGSPSHIARRPVLLLGVLTGTAAFGVLWLVVALSSDSAATVATALVAAVFFWFAKKLGEAIRHRAESVTAVSPYELMSGQGAVLPSEDARIEPNVPRRTRSWRIRMAGMFLAGLALALAGWGVASLALEPVVRALPDPGRDISPTATLSSRMLARINAHRERLGAEELDLSVSLTLAAEALAWQAARGDTLTAGSLSHAYRYGYPRQAALAQNAGVLPANPTGTTSELDLLRVMLASRPHRANIESRDWASVGIGVAVLGGGESYWVVLLGSAATEDPPVRIEPTIDAGRALPGDASRPRRVSNAG